MSSTGPDDRELERLVSETAGLQQRYRASSLDEPSATVDDAIRAAARREVSARPRLAGSPFSASWRIPLSIAAVVLVSATLTVLLVNHDAHLPVAGDAERPVAGLPFEGAKERDQAAPSAVQPAAKAAARTFEPAARPDEKEKTASSNVAIGADSEKRARSAVPEPQTGEANALSVQPPVPAPPEPFPVQQKPASPLPAPARSPDQFAAGSDANRPASTPAAAPSGARQDASQDAVAKAEATREIPATRAEAKDQTALRDARIAPPASVQGLPEVAAKVPPAAEERATAGSLSKKQTASPASESGPAVKLWEQDPRAWLKHVDELRASGRVEDAKASFKAFRSRYPDYPLPAGFVVPGG